MSEDVVDETGAPAAAVARSAKYRQAAVVYLHVGLLYLFAVWELAKVDAIPAERGPVWLWLTIGVVIVVVVVWGLWSWQNRWFARVIWALHALRLPALISGAFIATEVKAGEVLTPEFYMFALVIVLINLGFLARAGWDL